MLEFSYNDSHRPLTVSQADHIELLFLGQSRQSPILETMVCPLLLLRFGQAGLRFGRAGTPHHFFHGGTQLMLPILLAA